MKLAINADQRRAVLTVLVIGLVWAVLDQWTKYLAVAHLTTLMEGVEGLGARIALFYGTHHLYEYATQPVQIVPPVWEHLYVQNPAGAFGLLSGAAAPVRRTFFIVVALVASGGLLWMAARSAGAGLRDRFTRIALGLVLGGAVGNLIDRAIHGYVIDFIHWHYGDLSWPPFNIADTGIVVGVIALLLLLGRAEAPATSSAASGRRAG